MGLFGGTKKKEEKPDPAVQAAAATAASQQAKSIDKAKIDDVTRSIRTAVNLNELLISTAAKVKDIVIADRVTIYATEFDNNLLVSRVMDGSEVKAIEVPISNTSIAGYVATNAKAVNIRDAYDGEELKQLYYELKFDQSWDKKTGFRTKQVLCVPVIFQSKVQGVIQAINKKSAEGAPFSSGELQLIKQLSDALAPDLYKIKTFEESQRALEQQKRLRAVSDKMHSAANIEDILSSLVLDISGLIDVEAISLYIVDKTTDELIAKYRVKDDFEEIRLPKSNSSIAGFCVVNNKVVVIANVNDKQELAKVHPDLKFDSSWDVKSGMTTRNVLSYPLLFKGSVTGAIQLVNKKRGYFTEKDIDVVKEIAISLGIAMSRQKRVGVKRSKYDALISIGLIEEDAISKAMEAVKESGDSIDHYLVAELKVPKEEMLKAFSSFYRTDYVLFDKERQIPVDLIQGLTLEMLKNERWVPIDRNAENFIRVIMEDPKDIMKRDLIQQRLKTDAIKFCVSIQPDIISTIDLFYGVSAAEEAKEGESVDQILDELKDEMKVEEGLSAEQQELKEDDSAIVKLVNQIVEQAYARKASDIHIEPYTETDTIVRYRVDGSCIEFMKIPKHYKRALTSRIKIMCNLDIAERRLPQDGKIKFKNFGKLDIELRVATIPTVGGNEDVVMRILAASKPLPLDNIGMSEQNLRYFKEILNKPYGIALVVGPTGSGKTTTLHSALGHINTPDMKIWTAEDPVEITQYQLRQVQIQPKIGFNFERAMRAFLRGDPDVIMVGEMRDLETTSMGVEASLTGHLVFSTLHTNNAPETITRLLDMGIDPFSFADALLGVLAQRLIRTVCSKCKIAYHPTLEEFNVLKFEYANDELFDKKFKYTDDMMLYKPNNDTSCSKCGGSGYKGRMGIHELLVGSDPIKSLIHKKPTGSQMMELCLKEGMVTLKQDGIEKVIKGFSTINEILAVCIK
ncbi:MAG: Flp pilus assembly complex ATPase component TadA [Planctomycetes bacterium]|nr:Flp pilus assembly complex ATPase component TadA [Planctomycetota bacterium]